MTARSKQAIHLKGLLGTLLGMAAACSETKPTSVAQRDSAGIRIIETPGATARADIGWTVGEKPDLQLGTATDDGPEVFDGIGGLSGGIAGLADGRILVVDGSSGELRFFDRAGQFVNKAGGLGAGPGEFRLPKLVQHAGSDSLLIFDRRNRRFTLYSSDGQAYRDFPMHPVPRELLIGTPLGATDSGIVVMTGLSSLNMTEGQHESTTGVRWITLDSIRDTIVAKYSIPSYVTTFDVPYGLTVPFNARPSATIGRRGFYVSGGHAPEIREFDNSGRLIRILRVIETPRPVTAEDLKTAIEDQVRPFLIPHAQVRAVYQRMNFPDHWPMFQAVRIDRGGWIWAELYRPVRNEASRWMIFDTAGVARGTVQVPAELEVHDLGVDYVLGRWRDSLRVEYVRRYRLDRTR